ncbi:ankyrin repeat domain-containing protein [Flavobacterium rhizosphaerae]|uniref:Ankyrin repeat domain-containing protein n=1 Tax=Flavobacterium rhizosphaerae TaxID=3163298 RepID=A0ABW8YYJ8_9FLAO
MKKILFILLLVSSICNAQQNTVKDVFDVARYGTVEDIKVLVKQNKDTINAVNAMGFTPLILACYRGNTEVAKYLAKNIKDVNYNSSSGTALAAAAVKGDTEMAKILLEYKADPNIADAGGITPLVYATQFQNKELVALLLSYKADKYRADNDGKTPYDHAVFTKNEAIINLYKK